MLGLVKRGMSLFISTLPFGTQAPFPIKCDSKGGGEYRGIGLLEPIWKVLKKVMDLRLEAIVLHNSLHGCLAFQGTGTGMIEAKLAQQLAHLEQTPFFGSFINLQKAFDAMD
jgi:hypothetical protein